jgi:hypothetical protein
MTGHAGMDPEALLAALVTSLGRRVREQRRAEERLSAFAFHEAGAGPAPEPVAEVGIEAAEAVDWDHYLARTLRAAGEGGVLALLRRLRDGERRLAELGDDRLAAADRIGALATAGLVARELDGDRVSLAPLGEALLALIDELETRLSVEAGLSAGAASAMPAGVPGGRP